MRDPIRVTLLSFRDLFATAVPFIALAAALLGVAYWLLDPTPPRQVVLATGQDQGAYAEFGKRYAQILKANGIDVRLRKTAGAAENIALLRQPGGDVDIAFVQGGADELPAANGDDDSDDGLVSLGSLFYEPVWLFYRGESAERLRESPDLTSLAQLAGWRVNIGAPGSGVPNLMARLLEANRIDPATITLIREAQTPAVVGLLEGRIDAIVFASAPESLLVQMLLLTPGVRLFDFAQSEAYARRFPWLSPVTLPRGVVDLAADIPPADVHLIAPTAALVARKRTHPALIQLFVEAAQQVHGDAGWFQKKGDFPNAHNIERPLAKEAQRFYASGPPVLQRYLPFWLANLVDRMWPVLVTIVAALIPLSRMLPPLYTFRVRSRIFRWYRQLREVENAIGRRPNDELLRELAEIERRVEHVNVPLSYTDELYSLRTHIHMVAERLVDPAAAMARAA
ncbi:MAG TPA: TAXI family TRAP transporter solute-binding subunit [Caldimonas sp.]|nr:TAXI family TRAP transporter solute-binding subunit [Caldimonas sp.]